MSVCQNCQLICNKENEKKLQRRQNIEYCVLSLIHCEDVGRYTCPNYFLSMRKKIIILYETLFFFFLFFLTSSVLFVEVYNTHSVEHYVCCVILTDLFLKQISTTSVTGDFFSITPASESSRKWPENE